jgi:hypothetical protein
MRRRPEGLERVPARRLVEELEGGGEVFDRHPVQYKVVQGPGLD